MFNSGFKKITAGIALAVGLGIGSAQAAIDSDNITGSPSSVGGSPGDGSGELFFSIFDPSNARSLTLDLNVSVQAFLADPLAGVSVQSNALQAFIGAATPEQRNSMVWNVAGLSNNTDPDPSGIFALTTVSPLATPEPFQDLSTAISGLAKAGAYLEDVNKIIVGDVAEATAADQNAYYAFGSWGPSFGTTLPFDNIGNLGAMETLGMVIVGLNAGATDSVLGENADLALGFWSLDPTSGTVSFSAVPIPAAIWLFGTAVMGLFGFRRYA